MWWWRLTEWWPTRRTGS
ncbi:unnamed protein product [Linum tenue]|uniref:Uncharacterized protein n=1 Tax=Linum tenue TaxID=586396 RepID=A0AAV0SAU7_9ROSI|nr:unnamed protein product [Linum tenue]CAI0559233.1 unnamed protein product [Linum tenue]CAI0628912.1 unnamed protein product [Linum tenue]